MNEQPAEEPAGPPPPSRGKFVPSPIPPKKPKRPRGRPKGVKPKTPKERAESAATAQVQYVPKVRGYEENGAKQWAGACYRFTCSANRRHGRGRCGSPAMKNGKCHKHGGASKKGAEHGSYKTGEYSAYMPTGLRRKFEESLADPKLMQTRKDIALVDARIKELLEQLTTGETGDAWTRLRHVAGDFRKSLDKGDKEKSNELLRQMFSIIIRGQQDSNHWQELSGQIDRRTRLVEAEFTRAVKMEAVMTEEQVMGVMSRLSSVVFKHVRDEDARAEIAAELRAVAVGEIGGPIESEVRAIPSQGRLSEIRDGMPSGPFGSPTVEDALADGGGLGGGVDDPGAEAQLPGPARVGEVDVGESEVPAMERS